jgi:kynurenine formamidase
VTSIRQRALILFGLLAVGLALHAQQNQGAAAPPAPAKEMWDGWMKNENNWGRWGKDDQRGALNLITPTKRKQAIALAKAGTVVSLAHTPSLVPKIPDTGSYLEIKPQRLGGFNRDDIQMLVHGISFTHIDALCHASHNDTFYNGLPASEVLSPAGCVKLGTDNFAGGIVTRGIILDIPYVKGVAALPPASAVTGEDLEAFEKMTGVKIGSGDAVFLHTGRWSRPNARYNELPGWAVSAMPWLKKHDVALVASDGGQDVGQIPGLSTPVHKYVLVGLGANLIDGADLEAAAQTARRLKRWDFMLTVEPVAIPGATGFPVNPLAIF